MQLSSSMPDDLTTDRELSESLSSLHGHAFFFFEVELSERKLKIDFSCFLHRFFYRDKLYVL